MLKSTKVGLKAYAAQYGLCGKCALVRVDFNVPLKTSEDGSISISDDTRIKAALPTITFLQEHKAKIILCSHLGRPNGSVQDKMRLNPVVVRLRELLNTPVVKVDDCIGDSVTTAISALKNGDILLLENVRFHEQEEKNDDVFAKELAKNMDVFVNDAFGTAVR